MLAQPSDNSPTRPLSGSRRTRPRGPRTLFWTVAPFLVPTVVTAAIALIGVTGPALAPAEIPVPGGPAAILERFRDDDAVDALHHVFLHYWSPVAGDSLLLLRLPSVVAMAIGAGLAGELGRRLLAPGTGLLAGLLLAVLPTVGRYAQEATPYAFAFLTATAATLQLYRTLDRPGAGRWTGYGLLVCLTALLHVAALLMLAGHAYTIYSRWRLSREQALFWWFPVTVLSLVPPAPLISLAARQHADQLGWHPHPVWDLARAAPEALTGSLGGLIVIGLAFAARWPDRALIRELAALALVPPLALIIASFLLATPVWHPRHVLLALVPLTLCAAAALRGLRLRALLVLAVVAAL
ncbi:MULTISPECIES: glycosyltransferase family 39 protein [Actinoplanes]|uniref:glycosyltransferase family 39 protein n=1 Tax=Actinoplanes TaxID=1865 RepID=UPI0005F2E256|nr:MULTISPECIES: glycosyltransferase family 39 protein [Actinoplanes]GLY03495.1 hypothetical protein Acsp01_38740 [Actinoplanes sp. NBRC 101535]